MFIVKITNAGGDYFMRYTVWTGDINRATRFESEQDARAAFYANRKFIKPAMRKIARIVEV